jgi:hypothetical protein
MTADQPYQSDPRLQAIADAVQALARDYQGECLKLLALLRLLEGLHQQIRDGAFQDSLPDTRQSLHNLLRDIEASGGWPYIYRMKLQALLKNLQATSEPDLLALLADLPATKSLPSPED